METYTETKDEAYSWLELIECPEEQIEVIGNIYENKNLLGGN